MSAQPIRMIVGLGNPGSQYRDNRHNAGVWFVEEVLLTYDASVKPESKFFASVGKAIINGNPVYVVIPSTYMNESGRAVLAVAQFYKIKPQEILVAHDELDHDTGSARLKFGGGHGGHNGLRDITRVFGNGDYARLRIGIGHPGDKSRVTSYVLGDPSTDERKLMDHAIALSTRALPDLAAGEWNRAVKDLHNQITTK